jgi:hypothetical protein
MPMGRGSQEDLRTDIGAPAETTLSRASSNEFCDLSASRPLMGHAEPVATA